MTVLARDPSQFVSELDAASEAHLEWTRRVLRCAVLHTSPGDDVLAEDAHLRCHFGLWFSQYHETLKQLDAAATVRVSGCHERMHDAIRVLCSNLLTAGRSEPALLDEFETTQSSLVADLAHFKTEILAYAARHDPVTGLLLRLGLEEEFQRCRAQASRDRRALVVLLSDVDNFKRVNDVHGHAVGDLALRHVATIFRAHTRAGEPVFRYGGDEFLTLLQTTPAELAANVVDRLLHAVRGAPLRLQDHEVLHLSVSAGLAAVGPEESMAEALERADRGLYAAKAAGRDRWMWDRR
jgi:diguanylate cyclase (GGDEF)-like protein